MLNSFIKTEKRCLPLLLPPLPLHAKLHSHSLTNATTKASSMLMSKSLWLLMYVSAGIKKLLKDFMSVKG
jgi:hypothetical protein